MNIENLDEALVDFINKYFPNLDWDVEDTSADADLILDEYSDIDDDLMQSIANATIAIVTNDEEFTITIRPSTNKLILYYID